MTFESREKKRRAKLAIAKSRSENKETMATRHYLTIVSRHCCCNVCGGSLREGREAVYRHTPKEILCKRCADRGGLKPRLSLRWEKQQRKIRKAAA